MIDTATQANILLLFGTFVAMFDMIVGLHYNPLFVAISNREFLSSMISFIGHPLAIIEMARTRSHTNYLAVMAVFVFSILVLCFLFLYIYFSLWYALFLFLPLTAVILLLFHYIIWFTTIIITLLVDVGNGKFNFLFSITVFELLIVFAFFMTNSLAYIHDSTFILTLINLVFCYCLTALSMRMVLKETTRYKTTSFTNYNLWKVALLLFTEFITILAFLCYLGSIYFFNAYSQPVTLFDLFYYIVITFGTVGYGDIIPQCTYTKCMAMLATFTSIACIGIMLSSFMSVSTNKKKQ